MTILLMLLPIALCMGLVGLGAFLWSLRSGQYEDMEGAAWRAIMDDDDHLMPADGESGRGCGRLPGRPSPLRRNYR